MHGMTLKKKGTEMAPLGHHFGKRLPFTNSKKGAVFSLIDALTVKDLFYGRSNRAPMEPFWGHLCFLSANWEITNVGWAGARKSSFGHMTMTEIAGLAFA